MRTIETQTGLTVDVQRSNASKRILYLVVDGAIFPLTRDDAARIGTILTEEAPNLVHTTARTVQA